MVSSQFTLGDRAVATVRSPKKASAPISTALRPNRSERRPPTAAPSIRPKVEALKNQPSWPGDMWNAGPSFGAATPAAWRSMPSNTATQKQSATVRMEVSPPAAAPRPG